MNKFLILIFIVFGSFSTTSAQNTQSTALKIDFEWGPDFDKGTEEVKTSYLDSLNTALSVVKAFQPEGNNLFNWTGSRTVLANKAFEIYYTNFDDPYVNKLVKDNQSTITKSTDALTLLLGTKDKKINIFLCLFADKIFFDEKIIERTDGFTRLTVALAHEIYGNTQMYLKYDPSTKKLPSRKQAEINAFTAGINFINKVIPALKNGILSKMQNKDKLIDDFNNALKREKAALEQWKKAADNIK